MAGSNAAVLWQKSSDLGTYSGGSWVGGLPLANLANADAQRVARSSDATQASTRWRVDLGAAQPRPVNAFALINHNGTTAATWRVVVTSSGDDSDPTARVLDTGALPLWQPTVTIGLQPWGAFPWNGIDPAAYPGGTLAFRFIPGAVLARYVWVYVSDAANPAGYFQAGRFIAGTAWAPRINMAYGARIRWADNSDARRTLGGRRIVTERPRYRAFDVTFERLSKAEALGAAFEIDRTLGKGGDFVIVTDPTEGGEFLFRRAIYASLSDTAAIEEPDFQQWRWSISAEELI